MLYTLEFDETEISYPNVTITLEKWGTPDLKLELLTANVLEYQRCREVRILTTKAAVVQYCTTGVTKHSSNQRRKKKHKRNNKPYKGLDVNHRRGP